jgi:hypothetical protein
LKFDESGDYYTLFVIFKLSFPNVVLSFHIQYRVYLELQKFTGALFFNWDIEMYNEVGMT